VWFTVWQVSAADSGVLDGGAVNDSRVRRRLRAVAGRPWLTYLAVGFAVTVVYYLIPAAGAGRAVKVVVYCAVSASAAAAVLAGVLWHRPRPRLPWLLFGLSQLVYAAADATFYTLHYVFKSEAFPAPADALYLAHYPLVVGGLITLIRLRIPRRDLPGLLDAAVLSVVAGMLSWLFLVGPQARDESPVLIKVTLLAYPVMDLAMLAAGLRLILGAGRRPASFLLLTANFLAIFTAHTLYGLQQLAGTYHAGNFLDAIWLGGNLALGAAALHPSMNRLGRRSHARERGLGPSRATALFAAALAAPATLLIQDVRGKLHDVPVTATACAVLFALTILRMTGLVVDQRRLAITDALTGLHTRRYVEERLAIEVARARRRAGMAAVFIVDVDHFKSINDRYGHPAGDRALMEIAARLRAATRNGDVLARYGGEEFALLVPGVEAGTLGTVAERLRHEVARSPIAVYEATTVALTVSVGAACYPLHGGTPADLVATADRALYAAKAQGRDRIVIGAAEEQTPYPLGIGIGGGHLAKVDFLRQVADEIDGWLSGHEHSHAVGRWTVALTTRLGHDDEVVRRAGLAGRLHDIGKVFVPRDLLTRPAKLSDEEWRLLREHPMAGYRLAAVVPGLDVVAEIIRQHHEFFDGNGYPDKIAGDDIRIEARVVSVCDAWAAMRADRPYQPAFSEDQAREQLTLGRGTQFDPDVVDLFLDLHEAGLVGDLRLVRPAVAAIDGAAVLPAQAGPPDQETETVSAKVFQNISS
jgi:diguanylate cyclase (GGDEF)-like protein